MCTKGKEVAKLLIKHNKSYLNLNFKNNLSYSPSPQPFHKPSRITLLYYNNKCNFKHHILNNSINKSFIRYISNSCYLQSTNYLESNYY